MKKLQTTIQKKVTAKEITMVALAEKAGCSRQAIYAFLENPESVSVDLAQRLAKAVDLKLEIVDK